MVADEPLEVRVARIEWRIDALDKHRDRVDKRIGICEETIGSMAKAEEIAREVAKRVDGSRALQLTFWQKVGAVAAGVLLVADSLQGLVR